MDEYQIRVKNGESDQEVDVDIRKDTNPTVRSAVNAAVAKGLRLPTLLQNCKVDVINDNKKDPKSPNLATTINDDCVIMLDK